MSLRPERPLHLNSLVASICATVCTRVPRARNQGSALDPPCRGLSPAGGFSLPRGGLPPSGYFTHAFLPTAASDRRASLRSPGGARAIERESACDTRERVGARHTTKNGGKERLPRQTRLRTLACLETFRCEMANEGILYTTHYYKERGRIHSFTLWNAWPTSCLQRAQKQERNLRPGQC